MYLKKNKVLSLKLSRIGYKLGEAQYILTLRFIVKERGMGTWDLKANGSEGLVKAIQSSNLGCEDRLNVSFFVQMVLGCVSVTKFRDNNSNIFSPKWSEELISVPLFISCLSTGGDNRTFDSNILVSVFLPFSVFSLLHRMTCSPFC